jgi:predicted nucleic acid-binding protein
MKKYVLDTNAVIHFLRDEVLHKTLAVSLSLYQTPNLAIISVVTLGELKAMALKNNWGERKIEILQTILSEFVVADINSEQVLNNYALLDAFSQNRLKISHYLILLETWVKMTFGLQQQHFPQPLR